MATAVLFESQSKVDVEQIATKHYQLICKHALPIVDLSSRGSHSISESIHTFQTFAQSALNFQQASKHLPRLSERRLQLTEWIAVVDRFKPKGPTIHILHCARTSTKNRNVAAATKTSIGATFVARSVPILC